MNYDVKEGLNKSLPLRSTFYTGSASRWATATSYNPPPSFERPDWFWSGFSNPKRTNRPPKTTESEEEWKRPEDGSSEEPKQDWYQEWQKREEEKDNQYEEYVAQSLEKQRKKMDAKIPDALVVTLALIRRLVASIDKIEAENKAADAVIEEWVGMDEKEGEFFEKIYHRNIKLNSRRRELETEMKRYRRLYKRLKTIDPEQGAEAEQIYRRLQKTTTSRGKEGKDLGGDDVQDQKAKDERNCQHEGKNTVKEEVRCQAEDSEKANKEYTRQFEAIEKLNEEHLRQKAKECKEVKRRIRKEEQMRMQKSSSAEQISMPDATTTTKPATKVAIPADRAAYHNDTSARDGANGDTEPDEELILLQNRLDHALHSEVKSELWDIAVGTHVCCFCGNTLTVFECPRYEQCGLRACEGCRKDH